MKGDWPSPSGRGHVPVVEVENETYVVKFDRSNSTAYYGPNDCQVPEAITISSCYVKDTWDWQNRVYPRNLFTSQMKKIHNDYAHKLTKLILMKKHNKDVL